MSNEGIKSSVRNGTESCHYCGALASTVDHIVPDSLGGPDSAWNFQPCCMPCNHRKANSWPTCECHKCGIAVSRFVANPRWSDKALSILTARVERVDHHIEEVKDKSALPLEARVRLSKSRERARVGLETVEKLVLTHRYPFDSVEI